MVVWDFAWLGNALNAVTASPRDREATTAAKLAFRESLILDSTTEAHEDGVPKVAHPGGASGTGVSTFASVFAAEALRRRASAHGADLTCHCCRTERSRESFWSLFPPRCARRRQRPPNSCKIQPVAYVFLLESRSGARATVAE